MALSPVLVPSTLRFTLAFTLITFFNDNLFCGFNKISILFVSDPEKLFCLKLKFRFITTFDNPILNKIPVKVFQWKLSSVVVVTLWALLVDQQTTGNVKEWVEFETVEQRMSNTRVNQIIVLDCVDLRIKDFIAISKKRSKWFEFLNVV